MDVLLLIALALMVLAGAAMQIHILRRENNAFELSWINCATAIRSSSTD
ncbi:hypothetical protein [Sinorhizobium meliloti]|nr:hypothetical protein [Sinorhizobium meliloti]